MQCACEMSGTMWWVMIVPIVALAFVAVVSTVVVRALWGRVGQEPSHSTSLSILEERYARGEIDHEEFAARKRQLLQRRQ